MADLPRTSVGSPYRLLDTKQRKVRANKTYDILAGLSGSLAKGFDVAKDDSNYRLERQAKNDLVNETVNQDLAMHEEAYAKVVVEGESARAFTAMQGRIKSGEFDDMRPEEYQSLLNTEHKKATDKYRGTPHYETIHATYNDFWVENEMKLTAGQSGKHRIALKGKQGEALVKNTITSMQQPEMNIDDVRGILYDPNYTMLTAEDRSTAAFQAAAIASADGQFHILEAFNKEFGFSTNPKTSKLYSAALKASHRQFNTLKDQDVYDIIDEMDTKEDTGTLTDADFIKVRDKRDAAGNLLYTQKQFHNKVGRAKVNLAKATAKKVNRQMFNSGIDLTGVSNKDAQETSKSVFAEEIDKAQGDMVTATESMGRKLVNQTTVWTELQDRMGMFESQPLMTDNKPNKEAQQRYAEIRALKRGMAFNARGNKKFTKYLGDALPQYLAIENAMKGTSGDPDEVWTQVAQGLELQKREAELASTEGNLSAGAKLAGPEIAEAVYQEMSNPWVPDIIERMWETDTPSENIALRASIVFDETMAKGFGREVAYQTALEKAHEQTQKWGGELFDTRGEDMQVILGSNDPDGVWNTVVTDPIISSTLGEMFGKHFESTFYGTAEIDRTDPDFRTKEGQEELKEKLAKAEVDLDPEDIVKEINMDTGMLEFRSPRNGGMFFAVPLKDMGKLHEANRHDVDNLATLERYYSDAFLSTRAGQQWFNKQSDLNDYYMSHVLGPKGGDVQEYIGMAPIEQTRARKEYHKENYRGVMGTLRHLKDFFTLKATADTPVYEAMQPSTVIPPASARAVIQTPPVLTRQPLKGKDADTDPGSRFGVGNVPTTEQTKLSGFIAEEEGTSDTQARAAGYSSGYDVVLGYGKYDPKEFDSKKHRLTDLTVTEAMTLGEKIRKNSGKLNSSAKGKWQLTNENMRDLMKRNKVDVKPGDKFDKTTQDKFFQASLEKRGLSKYKAGKLSKAKFIANLKKEWQGLDKTKKEWSDLIDTL